MKELEAQIAALIRTGDVSGIMALITYENATIVRIAKLATDKKLRKYELLRQITEYADYTDADFDKLFEQ